MDCGTTLVKYVLFIFNALMSILGVLAIVYGVLVLESISIDRRSDLPPEAAIPVCLIPIGAIVLLISFLGCCGAIRENVCMTMCYSVIMMVLLIIQLVLVIFVWANQNEINNGMREFIEDTWKISQNKPGLFESIERSFKCCGANGYSDYAISLRAPSRSCCNSDIICTPFNSYEGCTKTFTEFMSGKTEMAKYFGLGLIVVELVGFVFACCLANNIRNYKRRNTY